MISLFRSPTIETSETLIEGLVLGFNFQSLEYGRLIIFNYKNVYVVRQEENLDFVIEVVFEALEFLHDYEVNNFFDFFQGN